MKSARRVELEAHRNLQRTVHPRQRFGGSNGANRPVHLKRALQKLMWEDVGPLRGGDGLKRALEEIERIKALIDDKERELRGEES